MRLTNLRGVGAALVGLALVVVLNPGCGGGGGGGGPTQPPAPTQGITFTASSTAEADAIFLQDASPAGSNRLVLEVRAEEVTDLYGVSFDLAFPSTALTWRSGATSKGKFLKEKGVDTELLIEEKPDGNLVVGYSRLGEVSGVDGSGLLLSLEFDPGSSGSGQIAFDNPDFVDSNGESVPGISWIGGSVRVVR